MKRRLIKKWMNRYITPLIKDMPKTNYRVIELVHEEDPQMRYVSQSESYTCINGKWRREGECGSPSCGLRRDIQSTADALRSKLSSFINPRLRMIEVRPSYGVYLRIVDFVDWPEGYEFRPIEEEY